MAGKNSHFCEGCGKAYYPTTSSAEDPDTYCSQACELEESETDSGDLDFENETEN